MTSDAPCPLVWACAGQATALPRSLSLQLTAPVAADGAGVGTSAGGAGAGAEPSRLDGSSPSRQPVPHSTHAAGVHPRRLPVERCGTGAGPQRTPPDHRPGRGGEYGRTPGRRGATPDPTRFLHSAPSPASVCRQVWTTWPWSFPSGLTGPGAPAAVSPPRAGGRRRRRCSPRRPPARSSVPGRRSRSPGWPRRAR
jgi:hypothetical protein